MIFDHITGVIADMDGVLWRGNKPLPGLVPFFELMEAARLPFILATNNSSKTPDDYVSKLASMGVNTLTPQHVITSGTATVNFLLKEYPIGADVHVFGGDGLKHLIQDAGFSLVENNADVVIVGYDIHLNYDKLKQAALNVRAGARFISTNPDKTFPTPEGLAPGNGSLTAAIEAATDTAPTFIGKPHAPMFQTALERMGTDPATTLMIGDRLNTDIEGAHALGIETVLLFSGVTAPEALITSEIQPNFAFETLHDVVKAWDYAGGKRRR